MKINLRIAAALIAVLGSNSAFAAEGQAYLPPEKAAAILADGVPWSADAPNGRSFQLTLNQDGSGGMAGPLGFTLSVTWTVKDDTMCISNTMMSKCLRFREVPGGLQGWNEDKPDLKLTRQKL